MVPARKIRSDRLRFLPAPLGAWVGKILILLRFTDAPGFAEPTPPVRILTGGPRASPTQFRKVFLRTAGEGLKVNRPKAERSHPGVCPYENNAAATISAVGATLAVACTPGANPGGSPKGLPYPNPEGIIKTRRGGTCPFRGPDRPLRNKDSLRIRCRGGPIWPPVLEVSAASL